MALRPRTVKAGSLAAIAVPSVLGSTLVAPASAFAPVVQDIPGAATATQAPKSLFTSTVQPTLSQVAVQIRLQAEQAKQTQQAPATTAVQPIQKTYTAQAAQPAQATQQAAPSATFQSAQAAQAAQPSAQPTLAQVAQTPAATQNVAPTAQPAQAAQSASGVAATRTNQTFLSYTSPAGTTSQYHVYAEGVDFSKPVGVVFYFDGDYWRNDQSKVYDPSGELAQMAASAAAQNMLFVPVISPDANRYDAGVTWWEDMERNGEFFRSFASSFIGQNNLDASQVWTMGYSGGAEFITYELTDHNTSWRNGGGSIMVAGGDSDGSVDADATTKGLPMYWWVGAKDTSGNTNPVTWSARGAVESGYNAYLGAGFSDARVKLIDGFSHHDYDLPHILASSLDFAGKTPALGYTDVSSSNPNYNEISWNSDRRIMLGFADGTFRPNASVNRAQLATYLYRVAGRPAVNAPAVSPFSDVPANHPAYKEIFWLSQQGINGSDFRPLEAVTESTMAEFMYRAAGSPAQAQGGYASQALAWAASNGIGTGSTSSDAVTRSAMAGYLYIYAN